MILMALAAQAIAFQQIDFGDVGHRTVFIPAAPMSATDAVAGSDSTPASLPDTVPALPARKSRMSTLLRARDVLNIAQPAARRVAKLVRLDAGGSPQGSACTATFIGPRHLLTAGHCLVDRTTGTPHAGFRLHARYDAGKSSVAPVAVTRAWVETARMKLADPRQELVTPERCSADFGVIEIAKPLGGATGWAGMSAQLSADTLLHRFSYPHQSSAVRIRADLAKPNLPEQARAFMTVEADRLELVEPDFAPTNLYYEYGRSDAATASYVADRNGYVTPGRSGSALVDADGRIVALLSRSYAGTTYSCRLTGAQIGAISGIVNR